MAVDTTYDITGVTPLSDAAVSTILMAQNMSKYPCAIWFAATQTPPDPAVTPPDVIWGGGAYETSFLIPNGPKWVYGAPAGNAPFTRMKIIQNAPA